MPTENEGIPETFTKQRKRVIYCKMLEEFKKSEKLIKNNKIKIGKVWK